MKPFDQLTPRGRARRMRRVAHAALEAFGLGGARFVLARQAGNTLFRVYTGMAAEENQEESLFEPGQFLLRIHWLGYREADAIRLELAYLRALRRGGDLPVPEPLETPAGDLLVQISAPGVPEPRYCSLLRWVKGRRIGARAVARHYAAQGALMAEMHTISQSWRWPEGARAREYNWQGLFKTIPALGLPVDDTWALLPEVYRRPFKAVAERVREVMRRLGTGGDVYGLIHADLGVDANLLFWHGRPRVIDFDECGLGYWIHDLAIALEHCREERDFPRYREALLSAYAERRELPASQAKHLELFMAAVDVYLGLWANAVATLHPERRAIRQRAERCLRLVKEYLAAGGD